MVGRRLAVAVGDPVGVAVRVGTAEGVGAIAPAGGLQEANTRRVTSK